MSHASSSNTAAIASAMVSSAARVAKLFGAHTREVKDDGRARMMDEARFEKLYAETSRGLWSYVCRIGGSTTLADDIAQESFLRILRAPLTAQDEPATKAYLYRIATNLVNDHFRHTKRESWWRMNRNAPDVSEVAVGASLPSDMSRVFEKLKTQERALLWLAYVEGYDHKEIAEVLGLSSASVRVLLFRARGKLAGLCEEKGLKGGSL
jgi:RNA polymerase sigma-70 factor (ECF subfamily)